MSIYSGSVQRGLGKGRELGFSTANIPLMDKSLSGVFAGEASVGDKTYYAAVFANQERTLLETHLLDFEGDLYGREIAVCIKKKIRDSKKFDTEMELRAAIVDDVGKIRNYFNLPQKNDTAL